MFVSLDFSQDEGTKMRITVLLLAMFVASLPASAQSWKEYAYPGYSFSVSFPAEPQIKTSSYQAPDGRAVEAQVFSVTQDDAAFNVTIVDLPGMEESAVIDRAIKTLSQEGDIKVDLPARINRVYGRQLSIVGADGARSSVAVFYHKGRLYQIEGKAISGKDAASYAIRFQQSLVFTGGETNRPDLVREARRNCRGAAENNGIPGYGAPDNGRSSIPGGCRRGAR